jgi:glycine cleavage system H protein
MGEKGIMDMPHFLELRVVKFIFRVATDCYYNEYGVWAKLEADNVQIGISDYLQQRSGDMAFAEVKPPGTYVSFDEEIAAIETIKVNISLPSPVSGRVLSTNPKMLTEPDIINLDPYGDGWLAIMEVADFTAQVEHLLDAKTYYEKIKLEAEQEAGN